MGLFFFFLLLFMACLFFLSFFFSSRFFIAQVGILSLVVVLTFDDICSTVSVRLVPSLPTVQGQGEKYTLPH